jgi:ABC-2 type transport system permease protein
MTKPLRFLVRVGAMASKEVLHIRRDPRTLYMALAMPVVMLLIFGFGVSFDMDRIPLVLLDGDHSVASRALARAVTAGHEFVIAADSDEPTALRMIRRGQALAALAIPAGYQRELAAGRNGEVQLMVDGADGVVANQILSKIDGLVRAESLRRLDLAAEPPLQVKVFTLFNPEARSALFMVPGLAVYLLAVAAVLLTALTVSGEWERGSMEQLFASPVSRLEIVLGKLLPYLGLGMLQLLLVIAVGAVIFDVPIRGSAALLFSVGFLFVAGMLGQGLFISVVARSQLVATQAGALSSLLPSLLLSGMLVPIENMPRILQALSSIIPARYFVHAMRGIMLKGSDLSLLWPDLVALSVFAVAILSLATARFRRRLA